LALLAFFMTPHRNLAFRSEHRLVELEGEIFAQIGAALRATAAATAASSSEQIAKAEEVAKDVAEILKNGRIKAGSTGCCRHPRMAKTIVAGALFLVCQNGISLAAFLEFLLRIRIVRIAVRMELHGELAIGALDLHVTCRAAHAQYFVVIAFRIRIQNRILPGLLADTVSCLMKAACY